MRRITRESGQASLEYVAVVALVALVLAGASLTAAGPALAGAVLDGVRRALCLVAGGGCSVAATPCVVASATTDERAGVDLALVRIGRHAGILRQERSDGTIAITEIEDIDGGPQVGLGIHGHVELGRLKVALGGELQAALLAELGHGRTFIVHSREAADRLVSRLVHGSPETMLVDLPIRAVRGALGLGEGGIPKADEVYYEGGVKGVLAAGVGALPASLDLAAAAAQTVGIRLDRRTGRRTLYLHVADHAAIPLSTILGSVGESAEGTLMGGLTVDRHGRPVEFSLSVATRLAKGATSPLTTLIPSLGPLVESGDRYELDARLDLTNAENALAVRGFLVALMGGGGPQGLVDTGRRLAERLRTDARLDARVYDVTSSVLGADGSIALGVRVGGDFSFERSAGRLVQAIGRPPEGWWEQRFDCG
ncbi:MAG: hypothetical protein QOI98_473 [Solirubrobacteraceae bacterium]|nr:hypothetical protein [Solirubrobacteraceae bacterium]